VARKYVNPAQQSAIPAVTEGALAEARGKLTAAQARLAEAERADPSAPGWDGEYEAASAALRAAERRVAALEMLRAAQAERGGKRAAAVKAAGLEGIAADLAASRDQVAAAAVAHLAALAALASAARKHNSLLARHRAALAAAGIATRDDLVDADHGQEHPEGTIDGGGLVAAGIVWTPVPAPGVAAHALRLVFDTAVGFRGPFAFMRGWWRAHEVESRPDGLKVPSLEDVGAVLPPALPLAAVPQRALVSDLMPEAI
jgi:hypothetical protein